MANNKVTKSAKNNIEVLSANGLSSFVDDTDGLLKLKDVNGVVEPITNYTGNCNGEVIVQGTGTCSSMRCGVNNTASGDYSGALGGCSNLASGAFSSIINGSSNCALSAFSVIGGGCANRVFGIIPRKGVFGSIFGGVGNCVSQSYGFIGGGIGNSVLTLTASQIINYSGGVIGGGSCNFVTCGNNSFIGGGQDNQICGFISSIAGGACNINRSSSSGILGGVCNTISGDTSVIGGGNTNTISGLYSGILGGVLNTTSGRYSVILGGLGNVASGCMSLVTEGCCNLASSLHSSVTNGCFNCVNDCFSSINNGVNNKITGASTFSTILNAITSCAVFAPNSLIGGGINNLIVGRSGTFGTTSYNIILNGVNNRICTNRSTNGLGYNLIHGSSNVAQGILNTIIGRNNCATGTGTIYYPQLNYIVGVSNCVDNSTFNFVNGTCNNLICTTQNLLDNSHNSCIKGSNLSSVINSCYAQITFNYLNTTYPSTCNIFNNIDSSCCSSITANFGCVIYGSFNNYPVVNSNYIKNSDCSCICINFANGNVPVEASPNIFASNSISGAYGNQMLFTSCSVYNSLGSASSFIACDNHIVGGVNCIIGCGIPDLVSCSGYEGSGVIVYGNDIRGARNCIFSIDLNRKYFSGCEYNYVSSSSISGVYNCISAISTQSNYGDKLTIENSCVNGSYNCIIVCSVPNDGTRSDSYGSCYFGNYISNGCCNKICLTNLPNQNNVGLNNAILNGSNNLICNTTSSCYCYPLRGCYGGSDNTIVNGSFNCITNTNLGFIGNGELNRICKSGIANQCALSGAIINGCCNCISIDYATISNGQNNRITGTCYGFVGVSANSTINASYFGAIVNGSSHNITGSYSTISGGNANTISGGYSSIVNGNNHNVSGSGSAIIGGSCNNISANCSTINGGVFNCITSCFGFVGGGCQNISTGIFSLVANGLTNCATACYAGVFGGQSNIASCAYSFIAGCGITARMACALHANRLVLTNVPTSATGLPSGAIWSNAGVLTIVP